ncbi:MAG: hypothetical protein GW760_08300 [Legionella sp.]|jgi:hypothetical protein|nr:hypothetical protein [Legionella sp.]
MIKIELSNINALGGHAQASHKFLKNFKDELARESRESKENETIQHVLEHVETILSLSEMERTYITSNKISILSLFDSSGRETLAVRIEKFFNEVSRLDLEKMNIQSTQDHKVVEKFLTVFDMLQDFFPDHYDENLARVQKALREKIMAYSSVTDVREYVLSEPKTSITTFEHLSNYANAELNTIAELPDLNVKIEAYQKLKEFTEAWCAQKSKKAQNESSIVSKIKSFAEKIRGNVSRAPFNPEEKNRLIQKITGLYESTEQELEHTIEEISKEHQTLKNNFKAMMDALPQTKHTDKAKRDADTLIAALDETVDSLQKTKNLKVFKDATQLLLDNFSAQLASDPDVPDSWFQRNIIELFERFKAAMIALIQSIYTTNSKATTPNPSDQKKEAFKRYKEGLLKQFNTDDLNEHDVDVSSNKIKPD